MLNFFPISNNKILPKTKGVYIIKNIINNKVYIGSTYSNRGIYNRIKEHLRRLKKDIHENKHLQNSFNKHKENNFYVSVLEDCTNKTNEFIRQREEHYLNYYDLIGVTYNIDKINVEISEYNFEKYKNRHLNHINPDKKGVYFCNYYKKYVVCITRNNKQILSLYYENEKDARDIYKKLYLLSISEMEEYKKEILKNKTKKDPKKKDNCTSTYKGITFDKSRSKWQSRINVNSKDIYLGRFDTELEAVNAYNNYILNNKLNKELNNLESTGRPLNIINIDNDIEHI